MYSAGHPPARTPALPADPIKAGRKWLNSRSLPERVGLGVGASVLVRCLWAVELPGHLQEAD
jgi:hypothetical protein